MFGIQPATKGKAMSSLNYTAPTAAENETARRAMLGRADMEANPTHLQKIFAAEAFALANASSATAIRAADERMEWVEGVKRRIAALDHAAKSASPARRLALRLALRFVNTVSVRRVVVPREARAAARKVCGKRGTTPARWDAVAKRHGLPPFAVISTWVGTRIASPLDFTGFEGDEGDYRRRVSVRRGGVRIRWGKVVWRRDT